MASQSSTRPKTLPLKHQPEQQKQLRAKWTNPLTEMLVNLMVEQVHKGNKKKHFFSKKAWTLMSDDFIKKTSLVWDQEQLKNRFAVLKRQYSIVKLLLEQDDFYWEQTTGVITAQEEAWSRFIKEHPDAEAVKTDGCSIYPKLCIIFSEQSTDSVSHRPVQPKTLCPEPLAFLKEEFLSESEANTEKALERDKSQPNSRKKGRKGVDEAIAEAILEMAAASKLRAAAIKEYNDRYSVTDCVVALDNMNGVDEGVYNAALDLFNSRYAREVFLSLKAEKRLNWLCNKCSVDSGS